MRVASINGKRYVLVIVDDYSRYTWTHFLRSKDDTPKVLIDFLRLVQRGLQAQVRVVRTDKGTEFLNQTLHAYFATKGIQHQTSVARTPEQNGVVKRRNCTLVEAARTMLSTAKVLLFFWAKLSSFTFLAPYVTLSEMGKTLKNEGERHIPIPLSERVSNKPGDIVVNAQPVSQQNPVTGQVVKESDKVQQPKVKSAIDEKDNLKVKPAVAKEKPAVVKENPVGVTSKVSMGNEDVVKAPFVADKDDVVEAPVVADEVLVVADKAPMVKATDADKEPVKESASVKEIAFDVIKEIAFDVVNENTSDALNNKATDVKKKSVGKGKKSAVDKPKDNMPNPKDNRSKAHLDVVPVAENPKPNPKQKEKVSLDFPSFRARKTPSSLFSAIKNSRVDILRFLTDIGFSSMYNVSIDQLLSKLGWFVVSMFSTQSYMLSFDTGDKIEKLVAAKEIDFLFKVNFLTLFTNTMGKADRMKGKLPSRTNHYLGSLRFLILLYLDSTKFDRSHVVRTRPTIKNWSTYLMKQRQELELKYRVLGLLDLHVKWTKAEALFKRAKEKLAVICFERVLLESLMRKVSSDYPGDGKIVELQEKYIQVFGNPISFDVDVDAGNDHNRDDDGDDDNDNDSDGNEDEEEVNEGDKDLNESNSSFGFSKISLDDFRNDSSLTGIESVDPTEQETIVEVNLPKECELGDLIGDNSTTLEAMNQEITPVKLPTQKASPGPKKGRETFFLPLNPYMNKKTNLVIQSKSHEIHSESHVIYSEFHVIHFESHSKSMFDGTLASFDAKWESFSNQVNAQFKGNKGGLALGGIDLKKLFARHLKQYGHIRHTQVAKVKQTIPKLKWKTKENFHDCGIFTMLHMETFDGGPASNLDCGLPVESQLQRDMLR
nr:ulp1 protease family, C-terminal catalytic domain-containing protein [Tanacetum cinerariifolium]